jgi:hypothetical protein
VRYILGSLRAAFLTSILCLASVASAACGGRGFERALAGTITHQADVGARAAIGMPRGQNGWVTQMVVAGESSGFLAAAAGVAWRKPEGLTPRGEIAAGVATRSASIAGDCVLDEDLGQVCTNGLGPYGEATLGLDVPLGDPTAPALTFGVTGTLYLNSDSLESRLVFGVGVAWK